MTLYLVRHASAGVRDAAADDLERTLDEVGRDQARAVADRLDDVGIEQILSSPAQRCIETVAPLGERLGLTIETSVDLLEHQGPDAAVALVQKLAADRTTAVLCSHGDLIPDIVQRLARSGMALVGPRGWEKGSTWRFDTRGRDIVAACYLG